MPVVVACPHCNKPIANNSSVAGKVVKCPNCTNKFQMPTLVVPPSTAKARQTEDSAIEDASGQDFLASISQSGPAERHATLIQRPP